MEKVINIKLGLQESFRAYVELLKPILKLQSRNADVFAMLLLYNYLKKDIPYKDRFELIFSTTYRNEIKNALKISDATLHNCISNLRKSNLIVDNSIPEKYLIYPKNNAIKIVYNIYQVTEDKKKDERN